MQILKNRMCLLSFFDRKKIKNYRMYMYTNIRCRLGERDDNSDAYHEIFIKIMVISTRSHSLGIRIEIKTFVVFFFQYFFPILQIHVFKTIFKTSVILSNFCQKHSIQCFCPAVIVTYGNIDMW